MWMWVELEGAYGKKKNDSHGSESWQHNKYIWKRNMKGLGNYNLLNRELINGYWVL